MFSKNRNRHGSLASRLTFWYALIFTLSSIIVFSTLNYTLSKIIRSRVDQELGHEFSELANVFAAGGPEQFQHALLQEAKSDGVDKVTFKLLSGSGEELMATDNSTFGLIPVNKKLIDQLTVNHPKSFESAFLQPDRHEVRILYGWLGPDNILQVVLSQKEVHHFLQVFWRVVAVALVVLTVIAALVGWFMTRRALQGVEEVTRTANEITEGSLARRVEVQTRGDEIERLATTFNTMLDRIETLIANIHELTDNIAHDLRSPIARMRGMAEMTITSENVDNQALELAAKTIEECDRLLGMINTMLEISEAEAGSVNLKIKQIDIVALILDCCELFEPIAEEKKITILTDLTPSLFLSGDRQKLQRVIANLLDNALKYCAPEGSVKIKGYGDDAFVYLVFKDDGIGIAEEHLPNIFKRFYRCDQSRSQSGVGLGLSLARALCRAHGGDITVASELHKGSTFTVTLPREKINSRLT